MRFDKAARGKTNREIRKINTRSELWHKQNARTKRAEQAKQRTAKEEKKLFKEVIKQKKKEEKCRLIKT
jgi:hypothetical protein